MTPERRQRIEELQQEGRDAFKAGKSWESNPYQPLTMDCMWWADGYWRANDTFKLEQEKAKHET